MANWSLYETRMTIDGNTERDVQVNTIKSSILSDFANNPSYFLALRNGVNQGFNIVEESLLTINKNKKRAICKPDETIIVGDIIVFDNSNWICTESDTTSEIYDVGIISRCNNTLLFYDENSILYEIPCIIGGKIQLKTDQTQYITTVSNELYLTVPDTLITQQIKVNDVYKLGRYSYQIMSLPDDISIPNLLMFKLQYSEVEQVIPTFNYGITILNGDTVSISQNDTLTLDIVCTDNGLPVLSPILSYQSSNPLVAIVINGIVTCLSEGTAIITVTFNNISDSLNLTVQSAAIVDNYTLSITGANSIKTGQSSNYNATVYNNGIQVAGVNCIWNLIGTYASITSQDYTSCAVKAGSTSNQSVTLRASKSDDASISVDKIINITSLF